MSRCCWNRARHLTCFLSACVTRKACNSAHEQTPLSNDTIDSVLRHWEIGWAKDLSAPPHSLWRMCKCPEKGCLFRNYSGELDVTTVELEDARAHTRARAHTHTHTHTHTQTETVFNTKLNTVECGPSCITEGTVVHSAVLSLTLMWKLALQSRLYLQSQFSRYHQIHKFWKYTLHIQSSNTPACFDLLRLSSLSLTSNKHVLKRD